jgi:hypothetical protein
MQRSRVETLPQPPALDLDFRKSSEYSNTAGSGNVRLSPYFGFTFQDFTSYATNQAGPGFINSNGLLRMRTTGSAEPRFEYLTNGIEKPVRLLGLNMDIANYNYLQNSRTMTTAAATYPWVASGVIGAGTLNAIGPDGTTSAITLTSQGTNTSITQSRGNAGIGAGTKLFSVWLKRKTGSGQIRIKVVGTTYTTVAVTSEWQRFSISGTGQPIPGIQFAQVDDEIYVYSPQLSIANNSIFTPPNELIADPADINSAGDALEITLTPTLDNSPIKGEVGTYFIEIDMSDRGGLSQWATAAFVVSNGNDDRWYINIARNPLDPDADYVTINLENAGGEWYAETLASSNLNSVLRIAFSWDTRTANGTIHAGIWNDTAYPSGPSVISVTDSQITSLNTGDPNFSLTFGRIFYVTKFKMWNEYKSAKELQSILTNG